MSDDSIKSAQGVVKEWSDKPSGWTDFKILFTGRNNPTKISTNEDSLKDLVKEIPDGEIRTFTFKETEGANNPNTGRPYINRYLQGVAAADAGSAAPQGAGAATGPREYTPEEIQRFDEKERREFRSRAWAQAIAAMAPTFNSAMNEAAVYDAVKPLQERILRDVCGAFAFPEGMPEGQPLTAHDDDIPF